MLINPLITNDLHDSSNPPSRGYDSDLLSIPQEVIDLSAFLANTGGDDWDDSRSEPFASNSETEWDEEKHPRDAGGRFGSGGGGGKATTKGIAASKGSHADEGIDIEARPVVGGGTRESPRSARERIAGKAVDQRQLGAVEKWLAGEGVKPPPGPVGKVFRAIASKIGHIEHAAKAMALASAQYVKDKIGDSTSRLPKPAQTVANGVFIGLRCLAGGARVAGKAGITGAFSYWAALNNHAGRIAQENGATPDQAKKIRTALSSIDYGSLEATKGGAILSMIPALTHALHFTHTAAAVAATVPIATTAYIAGNAVAHPIHTAVAAGKGIADMVRVVGGGVAHPVKSTKAAGGWISSEFKKGYNIGGIKAAPTKASQQAAQSQARTAAQAKRTPKPVGMVHHSSQWFTVANQYGTYQFSSLILNAVESTDDGSDTSSPQKDDAGGIDADTDKHMGNVADMVADALEAHDYSDWYLALFLAALDHGYKVPEAIQMADAAIQAQPEGPTDTGGVSDEEAMTELYGDWINNVE